jgi:hypothetical protein
MKFLGKLVLWQKLLLIVVALLEPSALLSIFYLKNVNATVRQASTELTGARYTRELDNFLFEVIRHRAVASFVLNGDANRKDMVSTAPTRPPKRSTRSTPKWARISVRPPTGRLSRASGARSRARPSPSPRTTAPPSTTISFARFSISAPT